ncbi:MAG: ArsR family transcriptional regulator [Thermodesulfobacteriota bacterium]
MRNAPPEDGAATRDRILTLLRRGPATVEDLSREVGVTANSVRVQLAGLERDGLVRREGIRRRFRKPAHLYALSEAAEQAFSKAYLPLLATLLDVIGDRLGREREAALLDEVGRRLGAAGAPRPADPEERLRNALAVLADLGGVAEVERRGSSVFVRGFGCPLGEVVRRDAQVCTALRSLLAEVTGMPVRESCERSERPACRFEIELGEREDVIPGAAPRGGPRAAG